jgi:ATP-dependent exoDNAse (exonuclease V) alpha subunit
LQAIGAGPGLQIVASVVDTARVDMIVRQRDEWARKAVTDLANGRAKEALQAYLDRGLVSIGKGSSATVKELVDASFRAAAGTKLLIAKTNAEVRAINEEVRARLRADRKLSAKEVAITSATPSGQTQEIGIAVGDEVRFLVRQDVLGVINGTVAKVSRVDVREDGNHRVSAKIGERRVRFELSDLADIQGRIRLTHAYASTIYGVQGLTCDHACVLLSPAMNRHDVYVAASRARDKTQMFIDQRAVDAALRLELPLSKRKSAAISADDRLTLLAERFSRVQVKSCTLDPRLAGAERSHSRARDQSWELDHG